ncbi:MAG: electron transporter RnfE, partial [Erysipelotrichaceae bacterium]|nr:electron transporter RnfE [Erysipelotrichaceae bacterium]
YIVIIATLVTIIKMFMQAYTISLYTSLGTFISLIVVNCIILGRAESFASKNKVFDSAIDAIGMGLGYTFALVLISSIRQILATGVLNFANPFQASQMLFEVRILPENLTISFFNQPLGAFWTFAILVAILAAIKNKKATKESEK